MKKKDDVKKYPEISEIDYDNGKLLIICIVLLFEKPKKNVLFIFLYSIFIILICNMWYS